jgi:hypothetical protein
VIQAIDPSDLVDRVADVIDAELGGLGWTRSVFAFDEFPELEPQLLSDCAYSVGLNQTIPVPDHRQGRQRGGMYVASSVVVRFCVVLEALDQVADYRRGLDREVELMRAVMATRQDPSVQIEFVSIQPRVVLESRLFVGELRYLVRHFYSIDART